MNTKKQDIPIDIAGGKTLVNLKWFRGASRYNNGATLYKRKYLLRLITERAKVNLLNKSS